MDRREFLYCVACAGAAALAGCETPGRGKEDGPAAAEGKTLMKLAPCGLDCNICPQRPKDCDGCHVESDHLWCADCKTRVCCKFQRKLDNCSLCGDFPCPTISAFGNDQYEHHRAAVRTLHQLRAHAAG